MSATLTGNLGLAIRRRTPLTHRSPRYAPPMRRYNVTESSRQALIEMISEHIERDEHLNPDKPDRIAAFKRARTALEYDAVEVQARRMRYRVIEAAPSPHGVVEGAREEVAAELERYGSDRAQQGKEDKAARYARALHAVEAGALAVRVEGVLYRIVED